MEDRNSPEAMAARASQPDPIVMYLIVKESLEMSIGKTAAQCAHGSQMLQLKFNKLQNEVTNAIKDLSVEPNWIQEYPEYFIYSQWLETSFRKVVLRANDYQFERLKKECPNHIVVVDAGITEIAPGSETVLGLWPMYRSTCPKYLTKIQVLK